jgi:iron complex outermembrane receptor protein
LLAGAISWVCAGVAGNAQTSPGPKTPVPDIADLLVTTIEREKKSISDTAASVAVLTEADIHRSGATSIPEALRLVPGLDVARVDSHTWAISSRGFNDVFANKLLVMMDGRTIYTPLFSGVFWESQDTLLEDIERIEVVRGPGASLWGANAVNGVINIVTKNSRDTQGFVLTGGGGSEERGFVGGRFGAKIQEGMYFRVYGKYFDRDDSAFPSGADAGDSWQMGRGGFRFDWDLSKANSLRLQGDVYTGKLGQYYTVPTLAPPFATVIHDKVNVAGGNVLGSFSHTFDDPNSVLTLQAYFDRTLRNTPILSEDRDTGDVDLQHQFVLGDRQKFIWGLGFRRTHDDVQNSLNVALTPMTRTVDLYSAFLQDEIALSSSNLVLTLGSKFEHNDFTGFEVQPGARLLWKPAERHTVWASISRAVRTPSRAEDDIAINPPGAPPGFATIHGSRNFGSEKLIAYELGYRVTPSDKLSLDLTGFYNDYNDLRTIEPNGIFFQSVVGNKMEGETYGGELAATFQALSNWRWNGGYSYLEMQLHRKPGSGDATAEAAEGFSPRHQFFIRSSLDFGKKFEDGAPQFEVDATLRYVDLLPGPKIPSYLTMDVRLAWRPLKDLELAIVGQNLFDNQHPEFNPSFINTQRTEVERSVYGKLTWRF